MFMELLTAVATVVAIVVSLRLYFVSRFGVCKSRRDMTGKTVIVTGANSGVGLETALELAHRRARLIICCRTHKKGVKTLAYLKSESGNDNIILKHLDLSSFKSVKEFAEDILKTESRLDVLLNSAGVCETRYRQTEDGLEPTMATNHFGHFLLTHLLLPLLKKSAPSRVVVMTSFMHAYLGLNFKNMNGERFFIPINAYTMSALANMLFMKALHGKLEGTGVTSNAVCPGAVTEELDRNFSMFASTISKMAVWPFRKTPREGAQSVIYCCIDERLESVSGKYFTDCRETRVGRHARYPRTVRRLWEFSEIVTKIVDNNDNIVDKDIVENIMDKEIVENIVENNVENKEATKE